MNVLKLKGEIISKYGTQKAFATAIGWHKNKVSKIMVGDYVPDVNEAALISDKLSMSEGVYRDIFLHQSPPYGDKAM